jgi:ATP-dependent DNA helicase RecG
MLNKAENQNIEFKQSWRDEYLQINIEPYPYPVSYKEQYHYRTGSTKKELKGASLDKFLLKKQGKSLGDKVGKKEKTQK